MSKFDGRPVDLSSILSFSFFFCKSRKEERHGIPGVFVVGRKSGRVCRLCDFGTDNLLERVDALAVGVESVHEMHDGRFEVCIEMC